MQDLVDEMEEARADREEMQDFFADKAMEGQEDALDELEALEAEMVGEEMGKMIPRQQRNGRQWNVMGGL